MVPVFCNVYPYPPSAPLHPHGGHGGVASQHAPETRESVELSQHDANEAFVQFQAQVEANK